MTSTSRSQSRAARLHLLQRRNLAAHASSLLNSKEEALQHERSRLQAHASRSAQQWRQHCKHAEEWLLRSLALGANDELQTLIAQGAAQATVTPDWQMSMGVTYPGNVRCEPGPEPAVSSTAALRPTIDAYRSALMAAAEHAATNTALVRLDDEVGATRRRRRAIEEHLIPRLDAGIHRMDLYLDEAEREEALRIQLARNRRKVARP
jgi:V/A-type H+-transporting ATPase subunit D